MRDTLVGRATGILIAGGSSSAAIRKIKRAATAGATVIIGAPNVGGTEFAGGSMLAADAQLRRSWGWNYAKSAIPIRNEASPAP